MIIKIIKHVFKLQKQLVEKNVIFNFKLENDQIGYMRFSFNSSVVCRRSLSLLMKTCADLVRLNITLLGKHSERAGAFSLCSSLGSGSTYAFTYLEEKIPFTKKELD